MTTPPESADERLMALQRSLEAIEAKRQAPPPRPIISPKPKIAVGPKTRLALQFLAWGVSLFWLFWVGLFCLVSPPKTVTDLLVLPFSAVICWAIYQWHKHILIWVVRKASGRRG
jgi:hypothetical protein